MWTAIALSIINLGGLVAYVYFASRDLTGGKSWVPCALGLPVL